MLRIVLNYSDRLLPGHNEVYLSKSYSVMAADHKNLFYVSLAGLARRIAYARDVSCSVVMDVLMRSAEALSIRLEYPRVTNYVQVLRRAIKMARFGEARHLALSKVRWKNSVRSRWGSKSKYSFDTADSYIINLAKKSMSEEEED